MTFKERLNKTKEQLDGVSKSFCLAKWKQVTIHLQNGHTHSCHHPRTHKIPLDELKKNPSALHNTNIKKQARKEMLEGKRPSECDYCWNIEDTPGSHFSDRHLKSNDVWALPHFNEIKEMPWDADVNPSYVEVSFSNVCNFKCAYCAPHISSKWMEEIKQYGPYPTLYKFNNLEWVEQAKQTPIPHNQYNPYVEAFWKWWPELYNDLHTFRITGGEPLLSKDTFKVLDYIIENPNPNLELGINSNLGVPNEIYNKFIEKLKIIGRENKLKKITIFTSVDTAGLQAEYIRYGLNYNNMMDNLDYLLDCKIPNLKTTVMCTFNALSITNYNQLLKNISDLRIKHYAPDIGRHMPINLDIPYLRHPEHLSVQILTQEYLEMVEKSIQYMKTLDEEKIGYYVGYFDYEIQKLERLYDWMKEEKNPIWLSQMRKDFYNYFNEYDRRRNLNFLETFPEMEDFWNICKKEAEK